MDATIGDVIFTSPIVVAYSLWPMANGLGFWKFWIFWKF